MAALCIIQVKGANNMDNTFPESTGKESAKLLDGYIAGIAKGDRDALADLYHHSSASVYAFALSILKNVHDAEDVLQDCYLRIHDCAGSYRSHGKPMAWILTIARNLCMMRLREKSKTAELTDEDWNAALSESCETNIDDRILLTQCLSRLRDDERQIVVLHAVAGFRHREIAAFLDMPLPTVLSKYSRSLKKLKENLERRAWHDEPGNRSKTQAGL